jgi:hypothetical protein
MHLNISAIFDLTKISKNSPSPRKSLCSLGGDRIPLVQWPNLQCLRSLPVCTCRPPRYLAAKTSFVKLGHSYARLRLARRQNA